MCLGSRYDELNRLEEILYDLASRIDSLINIFGNSTNLSDSFEQKIGALKQEKNWTSKPKLIKIEGDKLPASYRQSFSAKVLYDKYHAEKSFVTNGSNPWHGQKIMFFI